MPDYSGKEKDQVPGLLKSKGSQISEFDQGTFRTDVGVRSVDGKNLIQSKSGGKELGGGYCAGVVLDWARRVLLSAPTRDEGFLTYGYSTMQSGKGTGTRDLAQSKERAFQTVGRMAGAWSASNEMTWSAPSGATDYKVKDETWAGTAKALDSAFDADRKENARKLSGKKFSSLVILDSRMTNCTADEWVGMLPGSLRPGAVTKFGFGKPGLSGHAVAVWQRKEKTIERDSFYFFDPNFGVYAYDLAGFTEALKILFWRRNLPPHVPYYATCAHTKNQDFSYVIFGPPNVIGGVSTVHVPSHTTSAPLLPANGYGVGSHGLAPPGLKGPQPVTHPIASPAASGLKLDLQKLLADTSKHIPEAEAFGSHGRFTNGWVKVPFTLKGRIEKDAKVSDYADRIKSDSKSWAIPKDVIGFMLNRL